MKTQTRQVTCPNCHCRFPIKTETGVKKPKYKNNPIVIAMIVLAVMMLLIMFANTIGI